MTFSDEAFLKKLRAAFVDEAHEQIERISGGLSQLAGTADDATSLQTVENTFRELHNMKGSARAVNFLTLEAVCQSLEDVFSQLKKGERRVTPKLLDLLHEVVDGISGFLTTLESDQSADDAAPLSRFVDRIGDTLSADSEARSQANPQGDSEGDSGTDPSYPTIQDWNPPSLDWEISNAQLPGADRSANPSPDRAADRASGWATDSSVPELEGKEESAEAILNSFVFDSSWQESSTPTNLFEGIPGASTPTASAASFSSGMHSLIPPTAASFEATSSVVAPVFVDSSRESIRIPAARLDELLMRAEDMLSLKIMSRQHNSDLNNVGFKFDDYSRELAKIYADVRSARQLIDRDEADSEQIFIESVLSKVLEFLDTQQQQMSALSAQLTTMQTMSLNDFKVASNTVDTFLENTKRLLMMPASTMLEAMPKMVRDLARELGKELDLTITGGTIQIDKRVLAQVKDPLVHILRNSIDHGMETPEVREKAGKSARGTLIISVMPQEGNSVEIVVTDDGAGINIEKVKEIGIKSGLVDSEKADLMTDAQAIGLIFQSSFSTSSTISEISGRGLGLAIAKENIEKLGGRLFVESRRGLGTSFRIKLPVTVATFRGVLIKCSDETLIVPTSDMERLLKVKQEDIKHNETNRTIDLDGREVALLGLDRVLDLPLGNTNSAHQLVMVLRHSDSLCAFEIDDVLEEQEILVKKLSKPLVRVRNVAGVTVLGSGKPAAILNVHDLLKSAARLASQNTKREAPAAPAADKRILVVDDTITARILMKNILETAGYTIKTANDGTEALKLLEAESFDMLVTDIEMPKMNGIELTSAARKIGLKLPIILVTSMTDQQFREQGTEAGADAFFVKSSFDQNNLLDVVKRLI